MTKSPARSSCPRCGEPASGQYCAACGASLQAQPCASCGEVLGAGARFCQQCGAPTQAHAAPRGMPPAWMIAAAVLTVLVAFIAGQRFGTGASPEASPAAGSAPLAPFASSAGGRAPDISSMTPEEAASRLFDRVMRYANEGKADSAAMFAPMAIMAYERIGPLDAHARYDIGSISAVTGDAATAAAQADTILKANPTHLLGLLLAAKAADLQKKPSAAAGFRSRFAAAVASERGKALPEYADHKGDIDAALSGASKPRK